MQLSKTPIAVAVTALAFCGAFSKDAGAAPDYWFKAPLNGATVSGTLSGATCFGRATDVSRVRFYLGTTDLGQDTNVGDGINCNVDTRKFPNGTHQLKAVATSASGATYTDVISIKVANTTTTPPTTPPTGSLPVPGPGSTPNAWFKAPLNGATVSGVLQQDKCYLNGSGIGRVVFSVDNTALNTDTNMADGMSCVFDTTKLANGSHMLKATAYNAAGTASYLERVTINVQNATTPPPNPNPNPTPTPNPDPAPSLPSTGVSAVPTFHSIGMYWSPGSNPGAAGCPVRFRATGETAWRSAQALWYDSRNSQCRGSLVHLAPNTAYEVQLALPGQTWSRALVTRTWSEQFPIARTVHVPSGSAQLNITQGGTKDGYVLYTPAPGTTATLDGRNSAQYNIHISAPYVIVRGFTLKGAKQDAIRLQDTASNVVIEGNDISDWGRTRGSNLATNMDSAVRARCDGSTKMARVVVQNNRIHHPRYGSNSWSSGHPAGAQAIAFTECGPNHVFRYNAIYSSSGKYFNDGIGGEDNFSSNGFPGADTDIYGNSISQTYDDAIESEGANRNVRIWGNYMDDTYIGIASTVTHTGPFYVFRNVLGRANTFGKSGQKAGYGGGRRYFLHNTMLQPGGTGGADMGIKGNTNEPMTNSISRNNIWHVSNAGSTAIGVIGGSENSFDYDLSNGNMRPYSGAEPNGIVGTPTYASGHGPASGASGLFQLAPGSRGHDAAVRLPNFNDGFLGAAPDVGAHETGAGAMKFGPR
jgi:hypothetical protein